MMLAFLSVVWVTLVCVSAAGSDLNTTGTNNTCCFNNSCSTGEVCDKECDKGFYGESCSSSCSSGCKNITCHKDTGVCTRGCFTNFTGDKCCTEQGTCKICLSSTQCATCETNFNGNQCESCENGFRGTYCNETCPDNCMKNICDRYNGNCKNRCNHGFWSANCNDSCPLNCLKCRRENGLCRKCTGNFDGDQCNQCIPGYYGKQCESTCPRNCKNKRCEKETGKCIGDCKNHFTGDKCEQCLIGNYGEQCKSTCPRNCENEDCAQETGNCIDGCKKNFDGVKCDKCLPGYHGKQCSHACPSNCKDEVCDLVTGNCVGDCMNHFTGVKCEKCLPGYYGEQCVNACPSNCKNNDCAQETGNCIDGCKNHFTGDKCCVKNEHCQNCASQTECSTCRIGYYGKSCSQPCSSGCNGDVCGMDTGNCTKQCKHGWYGDKCCMQNGHCKYCKNTVECSVCQTWYYGEFCNEMCPRSCRNSVCDRKSGSCSSGCNHGYSGDRCCVYGNCEICSSDTRCSVCKKGYYGPSCDILCSTGCKTGECHINGSCINGCQAGYSGDMCCLRYGYCDKCSSYSQCDRCTSGYYGHDCNLLCSKGCNDDICNKITGTCSKGCKDNISGDKCCHKNGFCATCASNNECERCRVGYFGTSCDLNCSSGCYHKSCVRISGDCRTCKPGYSGDKCCVNNRNCKTCSSVTQCLTCMDGYHGKNCEQNCQLNCKRGQCDKESGTCQACENGFYGPDCRISCPVNCLNSKCLINGTCEYCKPGFYGSDCAFKCSPYCYYNSCDKDGTCSPCKTGFHGRKCKQKCHDNCVNCSSMTTCDLCKSGFHGHDCMSSCPSNCLNCSSDELCYNCESGYKGDMCQDTCSLCKPGTKCDKTSGYCFDECKTGYTTRFCNKKCGPTCTSCLRYYKDSCTECASGWYGDWQHGYSSCWRKCSQNCRGGICDERTGRCSKCIDGFHGTFCNCPYACQNCYANGTCISCIEPFANPSRNCECTTNMCIQEVRWSTCSLCANSTWFTDTRSRACCPCRSTCKNDRCDGEYSCLDGCVDGYYGSGCIYQCSNVQPLCVSCRRNDYQRVLCDNCEVGYYPRNGQCVRCSNHCINDTCDSSNGTCEEGCTDGFWGKTCDKNCGYSCESCGYDGSCMRCEPGKYLRNCSGYCSPTCAKVDGQPVCNLTDGSCLGGCITNQLYGDQCTQQCSTNCTNSECDWLTGRCTRGCLTDRFGEFCDNICSDTCEIGVAEIMCHDANGTCLSGCLSGYYGYTCESDCNSNCLNGTCDRISGDCVLGCIDGFRGDHCSVALTSSEDGSLSAPYFTAIVVAFVIVLLGVAVVLVVKFTRKKPVTTESDANVPRGSPKDSGVEHVSLSRLHRVAEADEAVYANAEGLTNTRLATGSLIEYVRSMTQETYLDHFRMFPQGLTKPHLDAMKPENAKRNRYKHIYPYDHSRVRLVEGGNDYINASFIDGFNRKKECIASLGPLSKTTENFAIFWQMIWQECVEKIVMLTNLQEVSGMKCEQYWPDAGTSADYADVNVFCRSETVYADYIVRELLLKKGDETRTTYHLHFTTWPDKSIPSDVTGLMEFRQKVASVKATLDGPFIVHCSAGIGRTGTYIALDHLCQQADREQAVDIFACVATMREQRIGMVQTVEQYIFLHRVLAFYATIGCQTIKSECFSEYLAILDDQRLQQIFKDLETCRSVTDLKTTAVERNRNLLDLNRVGADVPGDRYRARLVQERTFGASDYINAVYLNSWTATNRFIVAQTPTQAGAEDFLAFMLQERCSVVVDLDPVTSSSANDRNYLLTDTRDSSSRRFHVSSEKVASSQKFSQRTLTLSLGVQNSSQALTMSHYKYRDWADDDVVPESAEDFVEFVKGVEAQARRSTEQGPILLHCGTAGGRSCLFYVVSMAIQKLETEREVSVVNTVQQARARRQIAIPNKEQLLFCYQCVDAYLQTFETYSNFVA